MMQPSDKNNFTRRRFLKKTASATAVLGFPTIIPSSALGNADVPAPSGRIVMGGIGIGGQGRGDQERFLENNSVQYVAVSDVHKGRMNAAKDKANKHNKNKDCAAYGDFREMLARPDIDAVHIATPDHWHAVQIIQAFRAGKDVFCQKPETRTLREGGLIVEAAKRYHRVFSGGSQRVLEDYRGIVERCWRGDHGPIKSINVEIWPLSQQCNPPPQPVPNDLAWEMWLGPAPWAPHNEKRCSGDFRLWTDYSGGAMTDWGAHHFGGATFAVDVRDLQPTDVILQSEGDKKFLTFQYPNGIQITHNKPGITNMAVQGTPGEKKEPREVPTYAGGKGITADFIECVKTRSKPFRDIESSVNTMALCHLGFIAYTLGRSLKWDAAKQSFTGDEEANRYLDTARREPWQI